MKYFICIHLLIYFFISTLNACQLFNAHFLFFINVFNHDLTFFLCNRIQWFRLMITKWWIFESTGILGEHSGLWPFLWHLTERSDWFSDKIESEHNLDSSKYSPCLIGVTTQIISWNSRGLLGKFKVFGQIKLKFFMKIDPHKIKNPKNS